MKKKILKLLCGVLCLAMIVTLMAGCDLSSMLSGILNGNEAPVESDEMDSADEATEAGTESAAVEATEPPTEPVKQVPVLSGITIKWLDDSNYTVGSNMAINEFGQISQVTKTYDVIDFVYDEDHLLTQVNVTDKKDGTVGYETFAYEGFVPTAGAYDPNDGFHSSRETVISTVTDDAGRIIERTEKITFKDAEDGSISYRTDKYTMEYDENDRVVLMSYYSDGEFDHTTELTYDENGNILSYSNKGESGREYLRVTFSYTMVDETSVTPMEVDPYVVYQNWEYMIEHIL